MTFVIPSSSSRDDRRDGPNVGLGAVEEKALFGQPPCRKLSYKPSSMWAQPNTDHESLEDNDDRFNGGKASLPCPTGNALVLEKHANLNDQMTNPSVASVPAKEEGLVARDRNNRFQGLKIETSAPKEVVEPVGPQTAPCESVMPNANLSVHAGAESEKNFPALPSTTTEPCRGTATPTMPKPKVFNIGITAVKLQEAKSKSGRKKHCSQGPLFGAAPVESCSGAHNPGESAWKTVVKGKSC